MKINLKNEKDLELLRKSGKILADALVALKSFSKEGVNLKTLDTLAKKIISDAGAKPAFLGYRPGGSRRAYPASICVSINDTIVHGLPTDRILKNGDILKIDLGVNYKGYFTDGAETVGIGDISKEGAKLIHSTREALNKAIEVCRLGKKLGDIGWVIEKVARENGFSVANGLTGHGVGFELHEEPTIYNYGERGTGLELKLGMVLAIEPMFTTGLGDVKQKSDDSFVTKDGSLSAHFEHTIAITEKGAEILTI